MGKRALAAFLVVMVALTGFPSRAQLPSLGETGSMTAGAERRIGDRIARELYRDPDYIDDPVLVEYVQGIWQPLLAAARLRGELTPEIDERFAWKILLGKDRSVNAFALPGGYLGLHLGLIGVVSNRDELASVLAHELSHVTQRHIARMLDKQNQQSPLMIGAMILGVLAASKDPNAASAMIVGGQAVAIQNQLNFSRDMEREADRVGYGAMTQAGFEPKGFVTMFEKLQQASRLNDNGAFPYLRSHPMTTERMADMQSRQQLDSHYMAASEPTMEHAMVVARAKVLTGPGVDVLRAWVNEAAGVMPSGQTASRRAGVLYAAALASASLRDYARLPVYLATLQELAQAEPKARQLVALLKAELALAQNQPELAAALATPGVFALPRPELMLSSQGLIRLGRSAEATPRLQARVASDPTDALAWQLLAAAYASQGQAIRAVRAEAESRVAVLDYTAALDRFKAAQDLARTASNRNEPGAHIEASIIDARTREVQSLLKQQTLER